MSFIFILADNCHPPSRLTNHELLGVTYLGLEEFHKICPFDVTLKLNNDKMCEKKRHETVTVFFTQLYL